MDTDTFLTALYVMADDFCKADLPPDRHPGPQAKLTRAEVVTLAIFGQWDRFRSEGEFWKYARECLRGAFPTLPSRPQFNRLCRHHRDAIGAFALFLAPQLADYEVLDTSAVDTRNIKRRGWGWLWGRANRGFDRARSGYFEGFRLLLAVAPEGEITGFGFGPGSAKEQPLADTFFALRDEPDASLPSVGTTVGGASYIADKGFEGRERQEGYLRAYGVELIYPPRRNATEPWPQSTRRWFAGIRQIVETVVAKLKDTFRLRRERPHALDGFAGRLAAKVGLHNFCIWLNRQLGRPALAFAELLDW